MIVDTSVLVALVRREAEADEFIEILARAQQRRMSAAGYLEASIVIDGARNAVLSRRLDDAISLARIVIEPVTVEQVKVAREAYRDFGKGSGHPARLNFGDCFSYALARVSGEPLLFKGDDFIHTDLKPALPGSS